MFGEISFVTNAAGNILQLAVSLDYSVFLLHRFAECRQTADNPEDAMVQALTMSTSSILSSGLTTVIGFLALCLMQFRIGPDLGLALAKGVAISLITVFVFMPALILSTYKLIDKTQHRSFMPSFKGFGKFVSCVMIPFVIIFAILIVPCYLASSADSFYYGASPIFGSATQLEADTEKIENAFGKRDTYVLMVPKNSTATQAEKYYPGEWYLAGEGVSTYDLMDTVTADMAKVNLVAIGAVFVVLLFTMKSFVLPVILVFSIETAIWINLSIPYFSNQAIFYIAYLIISSIQLGATVDYAILFTDRYREMRQTYAKRDAIIQTVSAVAVSILTSASVLTAVGFLLGAFSTHGLLSQLGYFLGKGTLCSLAIVLFVLPGLLYLCNKNIVKKSKEAVSQ